MVLIIVAPSFVVGAEPEKDEYPMNIACQAVGNHQQEMRWCKLIEETLINSDWLEPAVEGQRSFLQVIAIAEFCEKTQTLGTATTVVFVSPWFAGQYPWLMSNLKVLEIGDWEKAATELVQDMEAGWELSRDGLAAAMMYLNQQQKKNYKSTGGREHEWSDEEDPFDGLRGLFDRSKLCRGTDFMFHMSASR